MSKRFQSHREPKPLKKREGPHFQSKRTSSIKKAAGDDPNKLRTETTADQNTQTQLKKDKMKTAADAGKAAVQQAADQKAEQEKQQKIDKNIAGGNNVLNGMAKVGNAVAGVADMTGKVLDATNSAAQTVLNPSPFGTNEGQNIADAMKKTGDIASEITGKGVQAVDDAKAKSEEKKFKEAEQNALSQIKDENGVARKYNDPSQLNNQQRLELQTKMQPEMDRISQMEKVVGGTRTGNALAGAASEFNKEQKEGADKNTDKAKLEADKAKLEKEKEETERDQLERLPRAQFDTEIQNLRNKAEAGTALTPEEQDLLSQVDTMGDDEAYKELTSRHNFADNYGGNVSDADSSDFVKANATTDISDTALNSQIDALVAEKYRMGDSFPPEKQERLEYLSDMKAGRGANLSAEQYRAKVDEYFNKYTKSNLGDTELARAVARKMASVRELEDRAIPYRNPETGKIEYNITPVMTDPRMNSVWQTAVNDSGLKLKSILRTQGVFSNFVDERLGDPKGDDRNEWNPETITTAMQLLSKDENAIRAYGSNPSNLFDKDAPVTTKHKLSEEDIDKLINLKKSGVRYTPEQVDAYIRESNMQNVANIVTLTNKLKQAVKKQDMRRVLHPVQMDEGSGFVKGDLKPFDQSFKSNIISSLTSLEHDVMTNVLYDIGSTEYFPLDETGYRLGMTPGGRTESPYEKIVDTLDAVTQIMDLQEDKFFPFKEYRDRNFPDQNMGSAMSQSAAMLVRMAQTSESIMNVVNSNGTGEEDVRELAENVKFGSRGAVIDDAAAREVYDRALGVYNRIPDSNPAKKDLYASLTAQGLINLFGGYDALMDRAPGTPPGSSATGVPPIADMLARMGNGEQGDNVRYNFLSGLVDMQEIAKNSNIHDLNAEGAKGALVQAAMPYLYDKAQSVAKMFWEGKQPAGNVLKIPGSLNVKMNSAEVGDFITNLMKIRTSP